MVPAHLDNEKITRNLLSKASHLIGQMDYPYVCSPLSQEGASCEHWLKERPSETREIPTKHHQDTERKNLEGHK